MSDPKATPRIIRKKTGHFLEDFKPGQVFRHKGGKIHCDPLQDPPADSQADLGAGPGDEDLTRHGAAPRGRCSARQSRC